MFRVVVIDDEKIVNEGLCRFISSTELELELVGNAFNGEQGLKLCDELKPDIVITDIRMPVMNGVEMVSELAKKDYPISVIAISAFSVFSYLQALIKHPIVIDYLLKPINKSELHATLARAVDVRKNFSMYKDIFINREIPLEPKEPAVVEESDETLVIKENSVSNPVVRKVMKHIEKEYSDKDISLAKMAEIFAISPNHLSLCFKIETGVGFTVFLRNTRIDKAKQLLSDLSIKIYEIADLVGFEDSKYFSKVFKVATGMTPKTYRKSCV